MYILGEGDALSFAIFCQIDFSFLRCIKHNMDFYCNPSPVPEAGDKLSLVPTEELHHSKHLYATKTVIENETLFNKMNINSGTTF